MKASRLALLAAGVAAALFTGCAPPGNVAATVGDTTIRTSQVDFLTDMQCASLDKAAEAPGSQTQSVPMSQVRSSMVNTLVQAELNRRLAQRDDLSYDRGTLVQVMQQFDATVLPQVPAEDRDRFRDVVVDIYRTQLQVYGEAERRLADQGIENYTQEQADEAVAQIQSEFREDVDVEVNPEYGADDRGVAGAVDPSLSLPVSSYAKKSRAGQADPEWVATLPADQRCG